MAITASGTFPGMSFTEADVASRAAWRARAKEVCSGTYEKRRDEQRQAFGQGLFKTYLVESYEDRGRLTASAVGSLLEEVLDSAVKKDTPKRVVQKDDRFYFIKAGEIPLVVDAADTRYWRIESFAPTAKTDALVSRLVRDAKRIDQLWLPTSYQLGVPESLQSEFRGINTGFSLKRLRKPASEALSEGEDDPQWYDTSPEGQMLRMGGRKALSVYQQLKNYEEFKYSLAVYRSDTRRAGAEGVALSSLWFHGKLTLRGTWFAGLEQFRDTVLRRYVAGMEAVEAVGMRIENRRVHGGAVSISLKNSALDVVKVERALVDYSTTFGLIVTWTESFGATRRVDVVDTYSNDPLTIDIIVRHPAPELRVSFGGDACANVIPRLLANLQQFVDAEAYCPAFEAPEPPAAPPAGGV